MLLNFMSRVWHTAEDRLHALMSWGPFVFLQIAYLIRLSIACLERQHAANKRRADDSGIWPIMASLSMESQLVNKFNQMKRQRHRLDAVEDGGNNEGGIEDAADAGSVAPADAEFPADYGGHKFGERPLGPRKLFAKEECHGV